ncbi:unnamed protein product [Rhizophagus irregularis]|nr:unnamed protein product [Rhizophagus irregularis]
MTFEDKGIFEWDIIIEKDCSYSWVGVCASENFIGRSSGSQSTGWELGSSGVCRNSGEGVDTCPPFGDGTIITVHLDMNKRTCSFTVNGIRYYVRIWKNLPPTLFPVVSLAYPGRIRIKPHQSN